MPFIAPPPAPAEIVERFGNGTDVAVTISANTTLTRDMHYTSLRVTNSARLSEAGFRVFGSVSCEIDAGAFISNNGGDSNGGAPGVGAPGGSLNGGGNGGASGQATPAAPAGDFGGGNGGAGNTGLAGGTTPKSPAVPSASFIGEKVPTGGGGGGSGAAGPGHSGGGGGVCGVWARTLTLNGTIEANGGANYSGPGNEGGGGGGGVVIAVYETLTGAGVLRAIGGIATLAGQPGRPGLVVQVKVSE